MISKEKIDRINELAKKAKSKEGLTDDERVERDSLRKEYIETMKSRVREQLERIEFVDDKFDNKKN